MGAAPGQSQLATHACVGYFKETNGHNSSELGPSARDGEPRIGGEMAATKPPCVVLHDGTTFRCLSLSINTHLSAGSFQSNLTLLLHFRVL